MNSESTPIASILAVDDTVENLRLLTSVLGEQGYEVRPVTNGRQALLAIEHDPPDLILLDINMPQMNGYEVCRSLKQLDKVRDVPVIFLTALTDVVDKVKAFEAGGVDYVTKPFQFEEVLARVKAHVALRRAQRELSDNYKRLRALEELRDNLVNMIVHDMRSPLMVIQGRLELLRDRDGCTFTEDARGDLESSVKAAGTVARMANDLLDVSRLEAGRMPVHLIACDLGVIVKDVASAFAGVDRMRTIETRITGAVNVQCDATLIRRVLENLVSNGIKHTPPGSRLSLFTTATDARVRISVQDEGRGVPPEARRKIFEKFGTLEMRNKQGYHSAGLGLAFCQLAVQAHGGDIGVDAAEPKGSVFWFELPV